MSLFNDFQSLSSYLIDVIIYFIIYNFIFINICHRQRMTKSQNDKTSKNNPNKTSKNNSNKTLKNNSNKTLKNNSNKTLKNNFCKCQN
jgi:hypothetical protein